MSGLFMFILFFLNILTLFAVIILFLRQNRFSQVEKDQKEMVTEMEELMAGYIMEIKEENEAFLEKVVEKKQTSVHNDGHQMGSPQQGTASFMEDASGFTELNRVSLLHSTKNKALSAYKNQPPVQKEMKEEDWPIELEDYLELSTESEETAIETESEKSSFSKTLQASLNGQVVQEESFQEQVIALKKQGLSNEDIAKNLKRGKTEIELLLKFQTGK